MINALNLIWIILLSITFGMVIMAFFNGATKSNAEYEAYQQGLIDGERIKSRKIDLPSTQTLEELFDRGFESNFNTFKETTGGIIYGSDAGGQLSMIYIDSLDKLSEYYQNEILSINNGEMCQRPIIKVNKV